MGDFGHDSEFSKFTGVTEDLADSVVGTIWTDCFLIETKRGEAVGGATGIILVVWRDSGDFIQTLSFRAIINWGSVGW